MKDKYPVRARNESGDKTVDVLEFKVPDGAITSGSGTVDLTDGGPGGFVQYAASASATENVVQIPDASGELEDSILSQNAGGTAVTSAGNLIAANNVIGGYQTTATDADTTILTVASKGTQTFTGVTTQTVTLPVVTTLPQAGLTYRIINQSTGAVTVNSSGGNAVQVVAAGGTAYITNNKITADTTAAAWDATYVPAVVDAVTNGEAKPISSNAVFDALAAQAYPAGVKILQGVLTQSSTDPPVLTEFVNTLGQAITEGYTSPGVYTLTAAGAVFTADKTQIFIPSLVNNNDPALQFASAQRTSTTVITIDTLSLEAGAITSANGILVETAITIVVYP